MATKPSKAPEVTQLRVPETTPHDEALLAADQSWQALHHLVHEIRNVKSTLSKLDTGDGAQVDVTYKARIDERTYAYSVDLQVPVGVVRVSLSSKLSALETELERRNAELHANLKAMQA